MQWYGLCQIINDCIGYYTYTNKCLTEKFMSVMTIPNLYPNILRVHDCAGAKWLLNSCFCILTDGVERVYWNHTKDTLLWWRTLISECDNRSRCTNCICESSPWRISLNNFMSKFVMWSQGETAQCRWVCFTACKKGSQLEPGFEALHLN